MSSTTERLVEELGPRHITINGVAYVSVEDLIEMGEVVYDQLLAAPDIATDINRGQRRAVASLNELCRAWLRLPENTP